MIKILTIVGTRPELIRLSECIKYFDKIFNHKLIHTNQNFDDNLNKIFFEDLNIRRPNYNIDSKANTSVKVISKIFLGVERALNKFKPDAVLILGDTNSALSAIVVKKYKTPIIHIEAGNRCFNESVPEEANRRIIDHLADINITYSNYAKNNLLMEGLHPEYIIKLGSPLDEVLNINKKKIQNSKIRNELDLINKNYFLVSFHRDENTINPEYIKNLTDSLQYISKIYNRKIIFSTHPRVEKFYSKHIKKIKNIRFLKPFSFSDYINLQINADLVLSDSGSLIEESSLLGFKSICLRGSNERQEGFESGLVTLSKFDRESLEMNVKIILNENSSSNFHSEYCNENFSRDLAKTIISHLPIVNKKIWSF